ncbi:hypothetical protein KP79_PYT08406 [Mizuhopecten yessoensis]|uniref:Uncharacterized protein n=1 Tax=Mizuhopecten yessoensis TaxID=6573 RepID=A0A210PGF4_MIZYE|nr:hypothetical protein KP79_PYT08406 [Mizuhopecten yessoensis]
MTTWLAVSIIQRHAPTNGTIEEVKDLYCEQLKANVAASSRSCCAHFNRLFASINDLDVFVPSLNYLGPFRSMTSTETIFLPDISSATGLVTRHTIPSQDALTRSQNTPSQPQNMPSPVSSQLQVTPSPSKTPFLFATSYTIPVTGHDIPVTWHSL